MKPLIYIFILLCFLSVLFLQFSKLAKTDAELLQLDSIFSPLKKTLSPGSTVSLKAMRSPNEFFYRAQFIVAPVVLDTFFKCDTVLLIRNKLDASDTLRLSGYDTLCETSNSIMTAVLLQKSNNR